MESKTYRPHVSRSVLPGFGRAVGWSQMRFVKRVNERGVVTLPTEVREALGVDEGDIVEFEILGIARKATPKTKGAKTARAPSPSTSEDAE
jgi:AbrB family looped-hinge helix DNA binding protein